MASEAELLAGQADFLLDRLMDFESFLEDGEAATQFYGHVHPAMARLKDTLKARVATMGGSDD